VNPVGFPEANKTIGGPGAGQPEFIPLPIFTDGHTCVSVWALTWRERWSALVFGRFTLSMQSGSTQPPILPRIERKPSIFEESG